MRSLTVLLLVVAQLPIARAQSHRTTQASGFAVYDGTTYAQKPDLTRFGLKQITIIYSASMWKDTESRLSLPASNVIRTLALEAAASTGIAVIDNESWSIVGAPASGSIQKYQKMIQLFRQSAPSLRVGYYGFPVRNYTAPMPRSNSLQYKSWQAINDGLRSITQLSDVLFPSMYTFSKDQNDWQKHAIAQIDEAHRIGPGKPVYVFLWPQFYQVGKVIDYLPVDYWRMELETARQHADGVVIWGGTGQTWDNSAPWWLETQRFLKEIDSCE